MRVLQGIMGSYNFSVATRVSNGKVMVCFHLCEMYEVEASFVRSTLM